MFFLSFTPSTFDRSSQKQEIKNGYAFEVVKTCTFFVRCDFPFYILTNNMICTQMKQVAKLTTICTEKVTTNH